jgi:hypothetical protein
MSEILGNRSLYPLLNYMSFIKESPEAIEECLLNWQNPLISRFGNTFKCLKGPIEKMPQSVLHLCPLNTTELRRYLIIPTLNNWTLFLDNGHLGTDRTAPIVLSEKLGVETVYTMFRSETGQAIFEYYGSGKQIRFLAVVKESGWRFYNVGRAFDFEYTDRYKSRVVKNRLDRDMLIDYASKFGIDLENSDYYEEANAIVIEKLGRKFETTRELSLAEAQSFFK